MLIGREEQSVQQWKQSLNSYQRSKRSKRPFGKVGVVVQRNLKGDVLQKEMRFNPVLQSFRDERESYRTIEHEEIEKAKQQIKHLKNNYKYNVDYDIINFAPAIALPSKLRPASLPSDRKKEYKDPTYYSFNIIDGRDYGEDYLNSRSLRHQKHYQRKIHPDTRPYNIISGSYPDGIDSSFEQSLDLSLRHSAVTQQYDPIYNKYCNPEEEEQYQRQRKQAEDAAQSPNSKLPPSYRNRESLSLDPTAAPSAVVQSLDARKEKAKERYRLKYIVEDEHQTRGKFQAELKEMAAKNRVHEGRIEQEKAREFNILNSKLYEPNRAEALFGKEITGGVYDLRPYANTQKNRSAIKQSGFSKLQQ